MSSQHEEWKRKWPTLSADLQKRLTKLRKRAEAGKPLFSKGDRHPYELTRTPTKFATLGHADRRRRGEESV